MKEILSFCNLHRLTTFCFIKSAYFPLYPVFITEGCVCRGKVKNRQIQ